MTSTTSWPDFDPITQASLAKSFDVPVESLAATLVATYGPRPTTAFVQDTWTTLRVSGFATDPAARASLLADLRAAGCTERRGETAQDEVLELHGARHDSQLRAIVLAHLVDRVVETPTEDVTWDGSDAGMAVIQFVFDSLLIDEQWSVGRPRGFTWWSHRLAQHVDASPPMDPGDGALASVITVRTDVVVEVPAQVDPTELVASLNREASLNALVWDPDTRTISECGSLTVYDDTVELWAPVLMAATAFQNASAHRKAANLAQALGARPAFTDHPTSGPRGEMDEVLTFADQIAATVGQESSRFSGPFIEALVSFELPWLLATGDGSGFTAEIAFLGDHTIAELRPGTPAESALLQVRPDEPHPDLGSGALLILRLPIALQEVQAATLANELNRLAARGLPMVPLLGSWCSDGEGTVTHVAFVSSLLAQPGLLQNLAILELTLANWAASLLLAEP